MPVATQFATTIRTVVHVVVDCELRAYLPESLLLAVAIADENG
jgi:hypothetical protein